MLYPSGLSGSAAFCVFLAKSSQLTCRCVPALADTTSFTAVWSLYSPQLQGSALSHETDDMPLPHTAQQWLFSVPSPAFLLKQGYLFSCYSMQGHILYSSLFKKWHDEFKCPFYFLFFCRLLICFSLENRALCVGMPRSAFPCWILKNCVWMLLSKQKALCVRWNTECLVCFSR